MYIISLYTQWWFQNEWVYMFCVQMMLALTATLMWLFQPSQSCLTMPSFISRISWRIACCGIVFWLHFVIEESKLELRLSRGDNEMSSIVLQMFLQYLLCSWWEFSVKNIFCDSNYQHKQVHKTENGCLIFSLASWWLKSCTFPTISKNQPPRTLRSHRLHGGCSFTPFWPDPGRSFRSGMRCCLHAAAKQNTRRATCGQKTSGGGDLVGEKSGLRMEDHPRTYLEDHPTPIFWSHLFGHIFKGFTTTPKKLET